jgi:hypothetical protein
MATTLITKPDQSPFTVGQLVSWRSGERYGLDGQVIAPLTKVARIFELYGRGFAFVQPLDASNGFVSPISQLCIEIEQ